MAAGYGSKAFFIGGVQDVAGTRTFVDRIDVVQCLAIPTFVVSAHPARLSQARAGMTIAVDGAKAYIAGGITSAGPSLAAGMRYSDVLDVFDMSSVVAGAVTTAPPMAQPRSYMAVALLSAWSSRLLVFAGGMTLMRNGVAQVGYAHRHA